MVISRGMLPCAQKERRAGTLHTALLTTVTRGVTKIPLHTIYAYQIFKYIFYINDCSNCHQMPQISRMIRIPRST